MWAYTFIIHSFKSQPRRKQKYDLTILQPSQNSLYTPTNTTHPYAIMLHHQPQILSPLAEMDTHSSSSSIRVRKMSAGGNRSWSEEEVRVSDSDALHLLTRNRRTIFCRRACRRCRTNTLLPTSRRPSWLAVSTIINCHTAAIAASGPLPFLPRLLAAPPVSLRLIPWEWTWMTIPNPPAMAHP